MKFLKMKFSRIPSLSDQSGFTLAELMIVVALIAAIMAFVGPKIYRQFDKSKVSNTKTQIKLLMQTLEEFKRECGFYPTGDQGLNALVTKPTGGRECKNYDPQGYLSGKKVPTDAWGNEFQYTSDGSKFVVRSLGADGADGGDDLNADISSDNME